MKNLQQPISAALQYRDQPQVWEQDYAEFSWRDFQVSVQDQGDQWWFTFQAQDPQRIQFLLAQINQGDFYLPVAEVLGYGQSQLMLAIPKTEGITNPADILIQNQSQKLRLQEAVSQPKLRANEYELIESRGSFQLLQDKPSGFLLVKRDCLDYKQGSVVAIEDLNYLLKWNLAQRLTEKPTSQDVEKLELFALADKFVPRLIEQVNVSEIIAKYSAHKSIETAELIAPAVIITTQAQLKAKLNELMSKIEEQVDDKLQRADIRKYLMDRWAATYRRESIGLVKEMLNIMQMPNLRLGVWSGPQGAGKGTNINAISRTADRFKQLINEKYQQVPEELQKFYSFLASFAGDAGEIITGTKGMFNGPEGEYAILFADMKDLAGVIAADGRMVGDDFTSLFTQLMLALRIAQGKTSIQIDLWPRSADQQMHFDELVAELQTMEIDSQPVTVNEEFLDLRLMQKDTVEQVKHNRSGYARVAKQLTDIVKKTLGSATEIADGVDIAYVEHMQPYIDQIKEACVGVVAPEEQEIAIQLVTELALSVFRMTKRAENARATNKKIRPDERQRKAIFKRVESWFRGTSPVQLANAKVGLISASQEPKAVVHDITDELFAQLGLHELAAQNADLATMLDQFVEVVQNAAQKLVDSKDDLAQVDLMLTHVELAVAA
jgi:hypothetical protein